MIIMKKKIYLAMLAVCFAIGEKSAGNYNKLFSDENKCIKIEISIGRTKTVLHSYSKRKRK